MQSERWVAIYDGRYAVSDFGRIMRLEPARGTKQGKILKYILYHSELDRHGEPRQYAKVTIAVGSGWTRQIAVHRLVTECFIGSCPKGFCVNHRDGDKLNNALSNLEYVTVKDNARHASQMGLLVRGEDHLHAKVTEEDVIAIREAVVNGMTYRELGEIYGLNRSTLHSIVHHKSWKHVGGPPPPKGRFIGNKSKLTEEKVRAIRRLYAEGFTMAKLQEMYGITPGTIHPLIHRKTWKHVH